MKTPNSVILRRDPNDINIHHSREEWYFIPHYQMVLDFGDENKEIFDTTKNLVKETVINTEGNQGAIHIKEYSTGFFTYGWEAFKEEDKPGHGGWWSSNPIAVFEASDIWFFEVVGEYLSAGWMRLKVEDAKTLVPEGYKLIHIPENADSYQSNWWVIVASEDVPKILKEKA